MVLKSRVAKLEARTGGGDDFMAFKGIIEAIHEADPIEGFDEGYAERAARAMCEAGYTVAKLAADIQSASDSNSEPMNSIAPAPAIVGNDADDGMPGL